MGELLKKFFPAQGAFTGSDFSSRHFSGMQFAIEAEHLKLLGWNIFVLYF